MTDRDERPVGPSSWDDDDQLPSFSGPDVACPKCGSDVGMKWYPENSRPYGGVVVRSSGHPEWLWRECTGCTYGWPEKTADQS